MGNRFDIYRRGVPAGRPDVARYLHLKANDPFAPTPINFLNSKNAARNKNGDNYTDFDHRGSSCHR